MDRDIPDPAGLHLLFWVKCLNYSHPPPEWLGLCPVISVTSWTSDLTFAPTTNQLVEVRMKAEFDVSLRLFLFFCYTITPFHVKKKSLRNVLGALWMPSSHVLNGIVSDGRFFTDMDGSDWTNLSLVLSTFVSCSLHNIMLRLTMTFILTLICCFSLESLASSHSPRHAARSE